MELGMRKKRRWGGVEEGSGNAEWGKRAESLKLKAESRGQKTEFGMRNGEGGIKRRWGDLKAELGMRKAELEEGGETGKGKWECGMWKKMGRGGGCGRI
jgi:hypothetical protein